MHHLWYVDRAAEDKFRILSSVGRASALHAECRQFEPVRIHQIIRSIAQSGSASGLGPEGREFESLYSDHNN